MCQIQVDVPQSPGIDSPLGFYDIDHSELEITCRYWNSRAPGGSCAAYDTLQKWTKKTQKGRFQLAFGVCSTQFLVKIYNKGETAKRPSRSTSYSLAKPVTFWRYFFCLLLHFLHARIANLPHKCCLITLLPGSVGLGLHLPGSPEPNSGCRSW